MKNKEQTNACYGCFGAANSAPSVKAVRRFRTKPYEAANLVKKQGEYLSELPHE